MGQEYTREFKVTIYRDTNKATHEEEYTDKVEAAKALIDMMDVDELAQIGRYLEPLE